MFTGFLTALLAAAALFLALAEVLLWGDLHCRLSSTDWLSAAGHFLSGPAGIAVAATAFLLAGHLARSVSLLRAEDPGRLWRAGDLAGRFGLLGLLAGIAGAAWVIRTAAHRLAFMTRTLTLTSEWLGDVALSLGFGALLGLLGTGAALALCAAARRRGLANPEPVGPDRTVAVVLLLGAALTARTSLAISMNAIHTWGDVAFYVSLVTECPLVAGILAAVLTLLRLRWRALPLATALLILAVATYAILGSGMSIVHFRFDGSPHWGGLKFGTRVLGSEPSEWIPFAALVLAALAVAFGPLAWRAPRAPIDGVAGLILAGGLALGAFRFTRVAGVPESPIPYDWRERAEPALAVLFLACMVAAMLLPARPSSRPPRVRGAGIASLLVALGIAGAATAIPQALVWARPEVAPEFFRMMSLAARSLVAGTLGALAVCLAVPFVKALSWFVREGAVPTRGD